jgi:hypothetical protein
MEKMVYCCFANAWQRKRRLDAFLSKIMQAEFEPPGEIHTPQGSPMREE